MATMAIRRFTAPLTLGLFTILALALLTSNNDDIDRDAIAETLKVDAIYYADRGYVEISYIDKSAKTELVVLEVLGLEESYQAQFSASEFVQLIPFSDVPLYGWEVHPVVLEVDHVDYGHIQIKTEIYDPESEKPRVIYSEG